MRGVSRSEREARRKDEAQDAADVESKGSCAQSKLLDPERSEQHKDYSGALFFCCLCVNVREPSARLRGRRICLAGVRRQPEASRHVCKPVFLTHTCARAHTHSHTHTHTHSTIFTKAEEAGVRKELVRAPRRKDFPALVPSPRCDIHALSRGGQRRGRRLEPLF